MGIVGKTGSGKSIFAKWILARWRRAGWRILIIDPYLRWSNDYAEKPEAATLNSPFIINKTGLLPACPVMLYRPSLPAHQDAAMSSLLLAVVTEGGIVVCFDEGKGASTSGTIPPGVSEVFVAGRKAQVPVYFLSQTPRGIHPDILSQCEWLICFKLNRPEAREYMAEYMGDIRVERPIDPYQFWAWYDQWDRAVLFQPLPESEIKQWLRASNTSG